MQDLIDSEEQYREAMAARIVSLLELPGVRIDPIHREIAREIIKMARLRDPIVRASRDVVMHRTMPSRYIVKLGGALLASVKK